ncbi:phosphoribosylamine--glycine ligase [Breznakibacter xylanolyticus]|uniref:Phosphoribosylamine--glycine ligase n=1 Tax=Breznakibacter xylanolyticus TaxID=990 RepID=A0A2W7NCM3_9BACT|nr:phosphoribosylamine--glycine ligase [Breznakibacter xylanolyticus]MBN2743149.1 phosphoribosylamine--glycine ligase [Marinilabiliaceae bacterium]PZX15897.1 phosphoribosylamine--glycine ligase [Breznakibacter xylanolyticus]
MIVLLLGSGGRENAIAWKLNQSKHLTKLFIAPGNAGTDPLGYNVNLNPNDFQAVKKLVLEEKIDMVVVGPEEPLVRGIKDFFLNDPDLARVPVIGPAEDGARLEGSKDFAKDFMKRHKIPTAAYFTVTAGNLEQGIAHLNTMKAPYVLKADGLAAGKGVLIIDNLPEAEAELRAMLGGKFGQASSRVVIEEFLSGIELSVFVLTDGDSYLILPEAKDYKRIGEGDTGLNTGGMGAVSPVPFANKEFMQKVENRIIRPTVEGLKKDDILYKGFIFFGLINVDGEPYVIEYNVRMGDPETEAVMPRIKNDLLELFKAVAKGELKKHEMEIDPRPVTAVMLVAGGYPGDYEKGHQINGLHRVKGSMVFHAGTVLKNEKVLTNGGRVMAVSSYGRDMEDALDACYRNIEVIDYEGMNYRSDIGFDL